MRNAIEKSQFRGLETRADLGLFRIDNSNFHQFSIIFFIAFINLTKNVDLGHRVDRWIPARIPSVGARQRKAAIWVNIYQYVPVASNVDIMLASIPSNQEWCFGFEGALVEDGHSDIDRFTLYWCLRIKRN